MKVPKSVLQGIAVAVVVSVTTSGCKKIDFINPDKAKLEQLKNDNACPACGRG
jgi:shikimate 5-dehydrogenase